MLHMIYFIGRTSEMAMAIDKINATENTGQNYGICARAAGLWIVAVWLALTKHLLCIWFP